MLHFHFPIVYTFRIKIMVRYNFRLVRFNFMKDILKLLNLCFDQLTVLFGPLLNKY